MTKQTLDAWARYDAARNELDAARARYDAAWSARDSTWADRERATCDFFSAERTKGNAALAYIAAQDVLDRAGRT